MMNDNERIAELQQDDKYRLIQDVAKMVIKTSCNRTVRCKECMMQTGCNKIFEVAREDYLGYRASKEAMHALAYTILETLQAETKGWQSYCYEKAIAWLLNWEEAEVQDPTDME